MENDEIEQVTQDAINSSNIKQKKSFEVAAESKKHISELMKHEEILSKILEYTNKLTH